jgi:hypothetical protein
VQNKKEEEEEKGQKIVVSTILASFLVVHKANAKLNIEL